MLAQAVKIHFLILFSLFIASGPVFGAVPSEWDGPWPGEHLWSECCRNPQGSAEDLQVVRSGGFKGSGGGPGTPDLSAIISLSVKIHEFRHTWLRDNQVRLRVNRPGHYRDWLTVMCVSSNAPFTLAEVLPSITTNPGGTVSPGARQQISYAWREKGGDWAFTPPAANRRFSGLVQVVLLLEIDVQSISPELPFQEITFNFIPHQMHNY